MQITQLMSDMFFILCFKMFLLKYKNMLYVFIPKSVFFYTTMLHWANAW